MKRLGRARMTVWTLKGVRVVDDPKGILIATTNSHLFLLPVIMKIALLVEEN